jgi:hypothetical protein
LDKNLSDSLDIATLSAYIGSAVMGTHRGKDEILKMKDETGRVRVH